MKIDEEIKKLVAAGKTVDEAVKLVHQMDSVSVGTIVAEGYYPYVEDGKLQLKFKEYDELKKAYPIGSAFRLYKSHEDHANAGIVYDVTHDDASRKIKGKIYTPDGLQSGQGLSAEFTTIEADCPSGTCQRDMNPTGVALAEIPRHPNNTVDGMSEIEKLKAELDAAKARADAAETEAKNLALKQGVIADELKAFKKAKRDAITTGLKAMLRDGVEFCFDRADDKALELLKEFSSKLKEPTEKDGAFFEGTHEPKKVVITSNI